MPNQETLDSVFRAYDVRGRTPQELNEEFFILLGKAYATHFLPKCVVVGHDIRPESQNYKKALVQGLLESGCNVVDLGEIATEMLYFAAGEYHDIFDGGLIVTASHNPVGWNGCKMVEKYAKPVGIQTGLLELKKIISTEQYKMISDKKGTLSDLDVYPAYRQKVLSFITSKNKPQLSIIADAGNGIGGRIYDYVFGHLDINIKRMYFVPDGAFPHHVPDPTKEENVLELETRVIQEKPDFGVSLDGDDDRLVFIDKKGRKPNGAYIGLILAKHLIQSKGISNAKILHDSRVKMLYAAEAQKLGFSIVECAAGHSNFKAKMALEQAIFGAETSAHFYYQHFYNCDSGMITLALLINLFNEGMDLTKELDYLYDTYPNSGEVNYTVKDPLALFEKVKTHYAARALRIYELDGISIEFDTHRINLRSSNTEPVLRLNVEATNKLILIEKFKEVEALISAPRLNTPSLAELK